mgnify:CR=1 FL=1
MTDGRFEAVAFNTTAYSYLPHWRPAYSIEETVDRLAARGYDAVELAACRPHAFPDALTERDREALAGTISDAGLSVVNVCSHFPPLGLNLGSPDDSERAAAASYLRGVAELAAALDAPYFHIVPGWSVGGQSAAAARDLAIEEIDTALADAAYGDATPLIEPLRLRECDVAHTADHALSIVDELSVGAGVLLDTFQLADGTANPVDAFRHAGDDLCMVHLADTDRQAPGNGDVPWELVFDALDDIGFDGPVSIEVWGDDPDELARASIEGLRELGVDTPPTHSEPVSD